MSPGANDGPKNTGTLPKSNRRSDRNRERSAANRQMFNQSYYGHVQHSNNLFQLELKPPPILEPVRITKNSNNRSTSSTSSTSFHDLSDIVLPNSRQHNYTREDSTAVQKMGPPSDRTQSPPCSARAKPINVNRMATCSKTKNDVDNLMGITKSIHELCVSQQQDTGQIESQLNHVRDYIRIISTMMEPLDSTSEAYKKLSSIVDDLYESEEDLTKFLRLCHSQRMLDESHINIEQQSNEMRKFNHLIDLLSSQEHFLSAITTNRDGEKDDLEENDEISREALLQEKLKESQQKLTQLREHQSYLHWMQSRVKDRIQQAHDAQNAYNLQTRLSRMLENHNVEQLENETAILKGKVAQLQSKKERMDHLISELQASELLDKSICSSEGSQNCKRDKHAELQILKAQLTHLKALMAEASKNRESADSISEPDIEFGSAGFELNEEQSQNNLDERQSDCDDSSHIKTKNFSDRPTVEDIQLITRELKEQSVLLQAARTELLRLKQTSSALNSISPSCLASTSTPPPSFTPVNIEKKQSNSVNEDAHQMQMKKRQLEDIMRKDQCQSSSVNRDVGGFDWNSQRGSNLHLNHNVPTSASASVSAPVSTPAPTSISAPVLIPIPTSHPHHHHPVPSVKTWTQPTYLENTNEECVERMSTSENLLDIGSQPDNSYPGNLIGYPVPSAPPFQQGSTEYYRQLVISSQAQQLQIMGTTLQQCCQILWSQQREIQLMRNDINQLQLQSRQSQVQGRINNTENSEEYSNLGRNVQNHGDTLDTSLQPSASLPNLVSLPNSSSSISHIPVTTSASSQHQQQLNNQVPPGNRANNYWDNFRSYSRQNLLSASVKSVSDAGQSTISSTVSTTNAASGGVNSSLIRDKRNREQGMDNTPSVPLTGTEAQYSLNLQLQSNLQQQERENAATRSNILTNDVAQQDNIWEEENSSYRLLASSSSSMNEDYFFRSLQPEMRETLISLLTVNRKQPNYLISILRVIKTITEDSRLCPLLLRSLCALQNAQPSSTALNEVTDQTASESCQSSDEDSDVGAILQVELENQATTSLNDLGTNVAGSTSTLAQPLMDNLEAFSLDGVIGVNTVPSIKPGYNEDLAEADQSRPESSQNQQNPIEDDSQDEAISLPLTSQHYPEVQMEMGNLITEYNDREDIIQEKGTVRLYQ